MSTDERAAQDVGLDPGRLFEAAPEALFVLRGDKVILVNERMIQLLGWDPTGLYVREAFPDWRAPAEDETPFDATLRMQQGYDLPVQVRIRRSPEGDHAIVALRDAPPLIAR